MKARDDYLSGIINYFYRSKRAVDGFSLSGEENPDQLMAILSAMTGDVGDELAQMIAGIMSLDRTASEMELRKFRNLKILVLWLQKEQKFGRYCYYGCYCLPEGSHNIASGGYGSPVDGVDRACRDFKQCYKCLVDEYDVAMPDKTFSGQGLTSV